MYEYKDLETLKNELNTDLKNGISEDEAKARFYKNGENVLEGNNKQNIFKIFINQLKDPMIYILLIAIVISFVLGEAGDSLVIITVVLLNAFIGVFQEVKTEKSLEMLKKISTSKATVIRDGQKHLIDAKGLVVGDLVVLAAGSAVGADLRIIESEGLKIDESSLTGESKAVEKNVKVLSHEVTALGDKNNLAYMSTLVIEGKGKGIVVSTGMDSEIGKIAKLLKERCEDLSPLQKKLSQLGKILGLLVLGICFILFLVAVLEKRDILDMFINSISLAVAAIPEGLPAVVTIVLALGVQKMTKLNAMVKRLHSVEALGAINVICSDKTGTITENKLKCEGFYEDGIFRDIEKLTASNLSMCAFLCNNAYYDDSMWIGSPMECELKKILEARKINYDSCKRVKEIEFNSTRKMMSTLNEVDGKMMQCTKGAFDKIIDKCNYKMLGGKKEILTNLDKVKIKAIVDKKSLEGKRILAFALKDNVDKIIEENMIFLGFLTFFDPPRKGVKESVSIFKEAGVETKMITGDYLNTAFSIAKNVGIVEDINECVVGEKLDTLKDEDFDSTVINKKVFARVTPAHKTRIVESLKRNGNVVAMTGDGVNDAPSLKKADVGISMGINGSDVAKEASDIVLLDDDFSTIRSAIKEGRKIYENIKKTIVFLLSSNFSEIIVMLVGVILDLPLPLLAIHILVVNLLTDSIPALCLGVDSACENIMRKKPKEKNEPLFSKKVIIEIALYGLAIAALTIMAYLIPLISECVRFGIKELSFATANELLVKKSQTYAFVVLSLSELFYSLISRNINLGVLRKGIFNNKYINVAIALGILITFVLVFTPLNVVLKLENLTIIEFVMLVILSSALMFGHEIAVGWFHMKQRNRDN